MDFIKQRILYGLIMCLSINLVQSIPLMSSSSKGVDNDSVVIVGSVASRPEYNERFPVASNSAKGDDDSVVIESMTKPEEEGYDDSIVIESIVASPEESKRFAVTSSTSEGVVPLIDDDSDVVESITGYEGSLPISNSTSEGLVSHDNDSEVVENIGNHGDNFHAANSTSKGLVPDDGDSDTTNDDTEIVEGSSMHNENPSLISNIFKGLPVTDDSDVVEVASNQVDEKDPNIFDLSIFGSSLHRIPDFNKTGRLIEEYLPEKSSVNPEELGPYIEGDILIPHSSVILKNGLTSTSTRWPNGIVPYEIGGRFTSQDLEVIANAINQYHVRTCIRFVPRTTQTDYISIVNDRSGCWSSIGRVGGKQNVNLQTPGCLSKPGTSIHELMHVLGFLHEQNREERDSFVAIQYKNVKETAYVNFQKISPTAAFGVQYDYGSVMHYSSKAFSQNGQPTIVARQPEGIYVMGQRDGFSSLDVKKINRMYKCSENPKPYELPVDLTKLPVPRFRPSRLISDFFGNFLPVLNRIG